MFSVLMIFSIAPLLARMLREREVLLLSIFDFIESKLDFALQGGMCPIVGPKDGFVLRFILCPRICTIDRIQKGSALAIIMR